jgi:hypothetical protein
MAMADAKIHSIFSGVGPIVADLGTILAPRPLGAGRPLVSSATFPPAGAREQQLQELWTGRHRGTAVTESGPTSQALG